MPQIPQPNAGTIPYYIFDIIMPLCRSWAEERVIMYIARNTQGYGKDEGWISKAQMVRGKKYTKQDHKWAGEVVCLGTGLSRPSVNKGINQALEDDWILERILCSACHQAVSQSETETFGEKAVTRKVVSKTCPHCSAPLRGREQFWYRLNFSKDTQYSPKQAIEDLLEFANEGIKERLIPLLKALKWGGLKALESGDISSFNRGIKEPLIKEENQETEKKEEAAVAANPPPASPRNIPSKSKPAPATTATIVEGKFVDLFGPEAGARRREERREVKPRAPDAMDFHGWQIADPKQEAVIRCFCDLFARSPPKSESQRGGWRKAANECLAEFDHDVGATVEAMRIFCESKQFEHMEVWTPFSLVKSLALIRDNGLRAKDGDDPAADVVSVTIPGGETISVKGE